MDRENNGETFVSDYRSKLYEMVNDPSTDSIVSWSESGKRFIVWDEVEFRRALKPWQDNLIRKIETDNKGVDSSNDGLVRFSSLSCYKEMSILAKKDRPTRSSIRRRRPLYIREVYEMVDDPSTDSVVSWSESGKSFIVWNEAEFLGDVLPRCLPFFLFKDMTSLTTWLLAIGYSKVEESEHWEYTADYLVRGQPPHPEDTSPCTPADVMITPKIARIIERDFASPKK